MQRKEKEEKKVSSDPKIPKGDDSDDKYWVSARTEEEALEKAAKKFRVPKEKITLKWGTHTAFCRTNMHDPVVSVERATSELDRELHKEPLDY